MVKHGQLLLCLFLSWIAPFDGLAQNLADSNFYLIDGLDPETLMISDKKHLDSCLSMFHNSENVEDKIKALDLLFSSLVNEKVREKYQYFQMDLIKKSVEQHGRDNVPRSLKKSFAEAFGNLGLIQSKRGNMLKSYEYHKRSLKISLDIKEMSSIARCLNNLGGVYDNVGNLSKAIDYYDRGLILMQELKDSSGMAVALNNIATIYQRQGQLDKAQEFFNEAYKIAEVKESVIFMAVVSNSLSSIFFAKGDTNKALSLIHNALEVLSKKGFERGRARSLLNLGRIHAEKGDFDLAQDNFKNAREIYEKLNHQEGIATSLYSMGGTYLKQGFYVESESYLIRSLASAREMKSTEMIRNSTKLLSQVYENQGEIKKGFEMFKLYTKMNDSLNNQEIQETLGKLNNRYQIEQQQQQIKVLNGEKKLKTVQLKLTLLIYGVVLVLLVAFGVFWFQKRKKRYEIELNELRTLLRTEEQEKETKKIITIPIVTRKKITTVSIEDVIYFRTEGRYVFLVDREGKQNIVDYTLSSLESSLPENFVRIHRSKIVNKNEVSEIQKTDGRSHVFIMKDKLGSRVVSSRGYVKSVRGIINEMKGQF